MVDHWVLRYAAWMAVVGLAVASWTPAQGMIRTGANGLHEHAIAYLITGIAFMIGYKQRSPLHFAIALSVYAALLEMGQMIAPGRHAGIRDWAAGAAGGLCAMILVVAWRALKKKNA